MAFICIHMILKDLGSHPTEKLKAIRAVKTISKSQMKNLERFKQEIVQSSDLNFQTATCPLFSSRYL